MLVGGGVSRGEFRPTQTRQLPKAVDLKGRFLFLVVVKYYRKVIFNFIIDEKLNI
jgi:hypothetical protein